MSHGGMAAVPKKDFYDVKHFATGLSKRSTRTKHGSTAVIVCMQVNSDAVLYRNMYTPFHVPHTVCLANAA